GVQQRLDDVALLLVAADVHDSRAQERQPAPVDGHGRSVADHLLVVDRPLRAGAAPAAELRRPLDAGEAGLGLVGFPLAAHLEAGVALFAPEAAFAPLHGEIGREPVTELGAELLVRLA